MSDERVEVSQEFLDKLLKNPKLLQQLKRKDEKEKFLNTYKVSKATPFKCPACSAYLQSGGTLWGPAEGSDNQYVCRKCMLVWNVRCITEPNDVIASKVREIKKGKAGNLLGESQSQVIEDDD